MIPDNTIKDNVTIYPNPAKNKEIFFKGNSIQNIEKVTIYDMNGKLIQSVEKPFSKGNKLSLKNLPKGIYWVIYDNQSEKIIIE